MHLRQLRYLCEIVDQNLNISSSARALHTSQPGISKQIRLLEEELGIDILLRRSNRIVGVTEQGMAVVEIARRMLREAENIKLIGSDHGSGGSLAIATSHTNGRYLLLPFVQRFRELFPRVNLHIVQTHPMDVIRLVGTGQADLGVCSQHPNSSDALVQLPFQEIRRSLVAPPGHPLLKKRRPTLEDLAGYPMIATDVTFHAGRTVLDAFRERGLTPNVVLLATDTDMIKAYVSAGLGIAIIPAIAYSRKADPGLRAVSVDHLITPTHSCIWINRYGYMRQIVAEFIQLVTNQWSREQIEQLMKSGASGPGGLDAAGHQASGE